MTEEPAADPNAAPVENADADPNAPPVENADDAPGYAVEAAARTTRGGQIVLTGDAQRAARGELHGSIEANTHARDQAIDAGHVEGGTPTVVEPTAAKAAEGEDADG